MFTYRLGPTEVILRSDGACIPPDPDNRDYQEYLVWIGKGNDPEPYVAPPVPIPTITRAQALLWLLSNGKTDDDVMKAINAIRDPGQRAAAEIEWKYRPTYHRDHPLFDQLGTALGLGPEQLDAAFIAAARL